MLGLLVAGVNVAAVGFVPTLGQRLFFPLLFLTLAVLVLALIAMGIRPVYLVVQPQVPAFATPAPAWKVLIALGFLAPASASIGAVVRSARAGIASTFDVVVNIPWFVLVALLLVEAWRGYGCSSILTGCGSVGLSAHSLCRGRPYRPLRSPQVSTAPRGSGWRSRNPSWCGDAVFRGAGRPCAPTTSTRNFSLL